MAIIKCSCLINYVSNQAADGLAVENQPVKTGGFSEQVYISDNVDFKGAFVGLCRARAKLLPIGSAVTGQRYQQVDPVGRIASDTISFPGGARMEADVPQMALEVRIAGAGVRNARNYTFRALPDVRSRAGVYNPNSYFDTALNAFIQQLAGFRFKGRNLDAPEIPLVSVDATGAYLLGDVSTFSDNQVLQILRTTVLTGELTSPYARIKTRTDAQHGIFFWEPGLTLKGGTVRLAGTVYPFFDPATAGKPSIVVKKVGRSLLGYRGRQSAKR